MNTDILSKDKDPMGAAILDYQTKGKAGKLSILSSMFEEDEMPVKHLFRNLEEMPMLEQKALSLAKGKVLDVGAGAGCHALALQAQSIAVKAIDISPQSCQAMLQRGVKNVECINLFDPHLGSKSGMGSEDRLQNNAAYIQSWKDEIKENPNALFTAIADADKIARYVSSKEQAYRQTKDVEYYAIVEETNAYSEQVYRCYICDEEGKVKPLINYGFADKDALEKELDKIKELDLWKDKSFEEVGIEALKAKSEEKEKAGKVEQEKSTEYIRPSELVAAEVAAKALPVSMDGRGLESLTRMSDRETLSRAETYYGKDGKFSDLYHGKNVLKSEEESEYGLMVRLAMFCGGDQDRLLRVFRSSGQYREEKPNAYYEKMAENSLKFISDTKRSFAPMGEQSGFSKGKQGINSKR